MKIVFMKNNRSPKVVLSICWERQSKSAETFVNFFETIPLEENAN